MGPTHEFRPIQRSGKKRNRRKPNIPFIDFRRIQYGAFQIFHFGSISIIKETGPVETQTQFPRCGDLRRIGVRRRLQLGANARCGVGRKRISASRRHRARLTGLPDNGFAD